MNAETLAEWFKRQGHSVIRTASSYWCDFGPHVFQAFPYYATIGPSTAELMEVFLKHLAVGARYSAPFDSKEGMVSYHAICDSHAYDLCHLPRQSRQSIQRGLASCEITRISFSGLAVEGWQLHVDTLARQHRRDNMSKATWENSCRAAADLPGFEAWGALVKGKLAAAIICVRVDDWIILQSQDSLTCHLSAKPNHALVYSLTKNLMARENIRGIFYGLQSLHAPASVDEFKFRMGYRPVVVRQRVVFNPLIQPLVNQLLWKALQSLQHRQPSNPLFAKAEGMVRFYLGGKKPASKTFPGNARRIEQLGVQNTTLE